MVRLTTNRWSHVFIGGSVFEVLRSLRRWRVAAWSYVLAAHTLSWPWWPWGGVETRGSFCLRNLTAKNIKNYNKNNHRSKKQKNIGFSKVFFFGGGPVLLSLQASEGSEWPASGSLAFAAGGGFDHQFFWMGKLMVLVMWVQKLKFSLKLLVKQLNIMNSEVHGS